MSSWLIMPDGSGVRLDGDDLVDPVEAVRYQESLNAVIAVVSGGPPMKLRIVMSTANHDPGDEDERER